LLHLLKPDDLEWVESCGSFAIRWQQIFILGAKVQILRSHAFIERKLKALISKLKQVFHCPRAGFCWTD
jgi:hypothetical protein